MSKNDAEQEIDRQKKADGRVLGAAFLIPFITIFAIGWLFPPYNPLYLALSVSIMSAGAVNAFQRRASLLELDVSFVFWLGLVMFIFCMAELFVS